MTILWSFWSVYDLDQDLKILQAVRLYAPTVGEVFPASYMSRLHALLFKNHAPLYYLKRISFKKLKAYFA